MKKIIALPIAVAIGATLVFAGAAVAQKKHAPKPVWGAMVAGLNDIQSITAAMMVFDMKRAATIAEGLQKREAYISGIEMLPPAARKGHGKVADAAAILVAAAKSGEEKDVANAINGVMQSCNACHYDIRDAERRKKMK
ncbi:MAG: cytochrome c [Sneathiella sp.]|nr:cytochrome c [Sneathiella sp.]